MKKTEKWKASLLALEDPAFFALTRNYLGKPKSPFNKQSMIDELSAFLFRKEVREKIAAGLDGLDREILSVCFLLGMADRQTIEDALSPDRTSWEIRRRLVNLRERLILYKDGETYRPAPQLESWLGTWIPDTRLLFPGKDRKTEPAALWLDGNFLTAFFSYINHRSPVLRNGDNFGKKALEEIKTTFPRLAEQTPQTPQTSQASKKAPAAPAAPGAPGTPGKRSEAEQPEAGRIALLTKGLLRSRCLIPEGRGLRCSYPDCRTLLALPENPGLFRLWGTFLPGQESGEPGWAESFLENLASSLPADRVFPRESLERIVKLLLKDLHPDGEFLKELLKALVLLNILIEDSGEFAANPLLKAHIPPAADPAVPAISPKDPAAGSPARTLESFPQKIGGRITVLPSMEITVPPEIPPESLLPLGFYCEILRQEQIGQYILTRESFFRGRKTGKALPPLKPLLEELSGGEIPQNMAFSLDHWETQFLSVRLMEGAILKVAPDRINIVENHPRISSFIREILAPGVYLLDPRERSLWEKALLSGGFSFLPPMEDLAGGRSEQDLPASRNEKSRPTFHGRSSPLRLDRPKTPPVPGGNPADRKNLKALLAGMDLPPDEKKELAGRIENKVVLLPEQLKEETVAREQREARGLDYKGKIRLIEDVLAKKNEYLELSWFGPDDELLNAAIIPRRMAKEDSELLLSGPYLADPQGPDFHIRVRKISAIKKGKLWFFLAE